LSLANTAGLIEDERLRHYEFHHTISIHHVVPYAQDAEIATLKAKFPNIHLEITAINERLERLIQMAEKENDE